MNFVVVNANSKAIPRTKIGAAIYFSTQDLYDFVMKRVFWVGVYPGLTEEMLDFVAGKLETYFGVNF